LTIQKFVIKRFGAQKGKVINDRQKALYERMAAAMKGKSPNQIRTLQKTILPRVALYKALTALQYPEEEAFSSIKEYLFDFVGKELNRTLRRMELLPGFFWLFRTEMYKQISANDNWDTEVMENGKDVISYNIKKCLWYDACREHDCPELCQIFCDVDYVLYGNMKKVGFKRQGTIGTGAAVCDFTYRRK